MNTEAVGPGCRNQPGPTLTRNGFPVRFLMLAVVTLVCVTTGCSGEKASPTPSSPPPAKTHEVTYAAEGEGTTAGQYTWTTEDGGTSQGDIDLPLKDKDGNVGITSDAFKSGAFLYFAIRNTQPSGSVTCQIIVDGKEISRVTSSGAYVSAVCKGKVP